ncbi:MAG: hypothetical protein ACE5DX_01975 [Candidatus Dojkabacteria bacterium]
MALSKKEKRLFKQLGYFHLYLVVAITFLTFPLVFPPWSSGFQIWTWIPLVLYYGVLGAGMVMWGMGQKYKGRLFGTLLVLVILASAHFYSLISATPDSLSRGQAFEFTESRKEEVMTGIDLGKKEQGKDFDQPRGETKGEKAQFISGKTEGEVVEDAARIIPVEQNRWNCNSFGCSYGTEETVWTISAANVFGSVILNLLSMGGMTWVVFGDELKKEFKS